MLNNNNKENTDEEIISLVRQNNIIGWENLYTKYAPLMYGAILRVIEDKKNADEILIQIFASLKSGNFPDVRMNTKPLYLFLLHYTHTSISSFTVNKKIKLIVRDDDKICPLVKHLLFEPCPLKEVAHKLAINEAEVKTRLRNELNLLRSPVYQ